MNNAHKEVPSPSIEKMAEKIVYEVDFGSESYGKVVELHDGTFQAYEIPLFGGEWIIVGHPSKPFKTKEEAIQCLNSLT